METYTPIQFNADVTLTCKREISIILTCVLKNTWI